MEVNRLPAIWYEAVLRWDASYVMGATLPGCPLFAVGRTRELAWGVTYLKGDTIDFFIEDCRRGGATAWQYRRGDAMARLRRARGSDSRASGRRRSIVNFYTTSRARSTAIPTS